MSTIGVIVPEITSHFFSAIIIGIQDIIKDSDYNIMICLSNESFEEETRIVKKLLKFHVDGVLVSPSSQTKYFEYFRGLQKSGIPVVVVDRDCPGMEADKVLVDDYSGAFQAVEYLIGTGCKNIRRTFRSKHHRTQASGILGCFEEKRHPNTERTYCPCAWLFVAVPVLL